MSASYQALVGPGVPQSPLDRFGNLDATLSGTGLGLVRDRFAIAGLHVGVTRMKRC